MLLNAVEKAMMNNPVRAAIQRRFEARRLLEMGGALPAGARALEIGCGRGVGTELVLDLFGAESVDAFDLDPDMVARAKNRLGDRARIWVGDAEKIDAADATYDAVFDFAIIHHVPAWRNAIAEAARVLRPGGRFYLEEIMRAFIHNPVWRRVLDHPMEDRFDVCELREALVDAGFAIVAERRLFDQAAWFVAEKRQSPNNPS
jgi:ubiquinone/menaquinone biosynthesis C-methylase UbiE